MRAVALAALVLATPGCGDNPFANPYTFVDGRAFPAELRGVIAPKTAYVDGRQLTYYLLGPGSARVASVVEVRAASGDELPGCRGPGRDATGKFADAVLDGCQGRLFPALPTATEYTPFSRVVEVRAPAGYRAGEVRSADDVTARGWAQAPTERIVDLALVDPDTTVSDPSGRIQRLVGFYRGLGVVALQLPGEVPVDASGAVVAMDLLVPEGAAPGAGGDVLSARAGMPGYSPLCRVVHFKTSPDFRPGDVMAASQIPEADRRVDDPPLLVHCAAP